MRCEATRTDGERCRATALPGKARCVFHDRDSAERCNEGRRQGGRTRSRPAAVLPADTPDLPLCTVQHVRAALGEAYNGVRVGRIDPKIGNCLGLLGAHLVRAIEGDEFERRLEEFERRLAAQEGKPS